MLNHLNACLPLPSFLSFRTLCLLAFLSPLAYFTAEMFARFS